jgi:hypothetical protein
MLIFVALSALAAEPTLVTPAHAELEIAVLVPAETVDLRAAAAAGVSVIDPTYRVGSGALGIIGPSWRPGEYAELMWFRQMAVVELDPNEMLGMSGVPVLQSGTDYVLMSGVLVSIVDDPISANPTPYPYPVPVVSVDDGADISGLEPSPFLVGDYGVIDGIGLLLDGRELVGVLGDPTIGDERAGEPSLVLAD